MLCRIELRDVGFKSVLSLEREQCFEWVRRSTEVKLL